MCAFGWQKYGEFFNPPNFLHYFFNIYSSLPHSFTSHLIISYLFPFPSTSLSFTHIPSCESSLALPFTFYLLSFTFYLLPFIFYLLSFTFYLFYLLPLLPFTSFTFPSHYSKAQSFHPTASLYKLSDLCGTTTLPR